jgi:hypothetical protein
VGGGGIVVATGAGAFGEQAAMINTIINEVKGF